MTAHKYEWFEDRVCSYVWEKNRCLRLKTANLHGFDVLHLMNSITYSTVCFLGNERVHIETDLWLMLYCRRAWMSIKYGISFKSISWIESFCEAGCDGVWNLLVVEHYIRKPNHLGRNAQLFEAFIFIWIPTQPVVIPLLQSQDRELGELHYP